MLFLALCAPFAPRLLRLLVAARDLLLELVDRHLRRRSSGTWAVWINHGNALLLLPRPRTLTTDATRRGRGGRKASGRCRQAPDHRARSPPTAVGPSAWALRCSREPRSRLFS